MIHIKIEGLEELKRKLAAMPRKVEIATQRALLKTAHHIREAEQEEMKKVFSSPTRWTLGAMKVKPTAKMEVSVGILDPDGYYKRANNYLQTQEHGGQRKFKAVEKALHYYGVLPSGWYVVPGAGAKMDAYGNMSAGQIRQILSWFDAAERWAGSTQNMGEKGRDKKRKGTKKTMGFEYFVTTPYRPGRGHNLHPGIYQRLFFGLGKSIKPVLMFVKAANYKPRFNFERVARQTAAKHMNTELDAALQRELAGMK